MGEIGMNLSSWDVNVHNLRARYQKNHRPIGAPESAFHNRDRGTSMYCIVKLFK